MIPPGATISSSSADVLVRITLRLVSANDLAAAYDFRHHRCGRSVAAALRADHAVDDHHPDPRQISSLNAFQHSLSRRMLSPVDHHEGRGAARLDQPTIKIANSCRVSCGETHRNLGWNIRER